MARSLQTFPRRWTVANTVALLFGYLLYTPIAHGLGGPHPQGMNALQILTHSIALAVVATSVAFVQRRELMPYAAVPWTRLPLAAVGFIALFLAGSYQPWLGGPDWDILLGSLVLGSATFLGVVPARGRRGAAIVAILSFPLGCFVGQLIVLGVVVWLGIVPDLQASMMQHSIYWISIGLAMGVIGGPVSGVAVRRLLMNSR